MYVNCGGGRVVAAGGGRLWPRPTAQVNLKVTDAPEPPWFDVEHYQFTVSEFAREGTYEVWRARTHTEHKILQTIDAREMALQLVIENFKHGHILHNHYYYRWLFSTPKNYHLNVLTRYVSFMDFCEVLV